MCDDRDDIKSPCINVCKMGSDHLCVGCRRTIEEIAGWALLDGAARNQILKDVGQRPAAAPAR